MVILLPELADEALTGAIDGVSGYVSSVGGEIREILQTSPWGRRRLAYTIRFNGVDYRDGYYAIWHFAATPSSLGDLERELKLDTRVIRHLLVIEDPKWGSPQEREAAREAANAPAESEDEVAAVAEAEGIVAEAGATDNAETAAAPAAAEEAADAAEAAEVVAAADEIAEVVEAENVADVVAEAESTDAPAAEPEAAAADTKE
jgi:small subunit ribosomal protein S6